MSAALDDIDALEWRPCHLSEDYEVSEDGHVRRVTPGVRTWPGKILRCTEHHFGYRRVGLTIGGKKRKCEVHTLVAWAFIGPRPTKKHGVAHSDGDPTNNHCSNLRWATQRENETDKHLHGTRAVGSRNGAAKLTEQAIAEIRAIYPNLSLSQLSARYGVTSQTISKIVNHQLWAHV